jgi:hypothetical protein
MTPKSTGGVTLRIVDRLTGLRKTFKEESTKTTFQPCQLYLARNVHTFIAKTKI